MDEDEVKVKAMASCLSKLPAFLAAVPTGILCAWIKKIIWGMLVVPIFHVPQFSTLQFYAASVMLSLYAAHLPHKGQKSRSLWELTFFGVFIHLFMLLEAWIIIKFFYRG